jgi:hypothetical protein
LGIITFIGDTQSILGYNLFKYLSKAFGEYYIWIFSPVLIAFSVFLFKEKDLHFNSYRAFGLLFFYVSATTLFGWYNTEYIAIFNLYPELEKVLGRMPLLFSALILLSASLYILFRYSVLSIALGATALVPSFAELKDSYSKDKKISKLKKESKSVATKARRLTAEEKKMQKESTTIEKQMEELRREKEQLAKMKQPKQLQLEKQKNRTVTVSGKSAG